MKLSIYTAVKDGLANDLHVEAMLRHHLPLADEIVVNEGYSSDATYSRITAIDAKIVVFRSVWEAPKDLAWCVGFKEEARKRCSGDWCIHLDCDEFIPEWEFASIRECLENSPHDMLPVNFVNFYGSYRIVHTRPGKVNWPARKMIIHRNLSDIEFWGDGSNVRVRGREFSWGNERPRFTVHHFGMVRHAAVLRYKWWIQGRAVSGRNTRFRPPKALFRIFPHDWMDSQFFADLAIYEGPHIAAVRQEPREFERDGGKLVRALRATGVR